jgi:hypothetical protein
VLSCSFPRLQVAFAPPWLRRVLEEPHQALAPEARHVIHTYGKLQLVQLLTRGSTVGVSCPRLFRSHQRLGVRSAPRFEVRCWSHLRRRGSTRSHDVTQDSYPVN